MYRSGIVLIASGGVSSRSIIISKHRVAAEFVVLLFVVVEVVVVAAWSPISAVIVSAEAAAATASSLMTAVLIAAPGSPDNGCLSALLKNLYVRPCARPCARPSFSLCWLYRLRPFVFLSPFYSLPWSRCTFLFLYCLLSFSCCVPPCMRSFFQQVFRPFRPPSWYFKWKFWLCMISFVPQTIV